ncbi:MAG: rod shape-determining protein MreC [Candidatus Omnitrophica bacterium]|nr:rod shape-determining protein MreC [Candidatus Omnitrophota bacterium]
MHLPSKIKSKYLITAALFLFVLILPVKNFTENLFISFSRRLLLSPRNYLSKINQLQRKNLEYSLSLNKFQGLQKENASLRKALEFKKEKNVNLVGADIIAFDPSSWRRVVVLNAGSSSGISEGAYAINDDGYLIGRVTQVKRDFCRLILLNDPDFSSSVFVGGKSFGLLRGGLDGVKVLYVENEENVRLGDTVWIKQAPFNFPLYIGKVKRLKTDPDSLFLELDVKLLSDGAMPHTIFILT